MIYIIGLILTGIMFVNLYFSINIDDNNKSILFLGLFGGIFLSICQSYIIKINDDKRHKRDQKEYVKKLRNTYLKEFREALRGVLEKYINIFRDETLIQYGFQDILIDNQIDIEKLVSNLTKIQVCRDRTLWDGTTYPKTIDEKIQNKTKYLRIVFFYSCYDQDYAKLCKSVEKLKAIYEVEDPKYIFPIFTSQEKEMLERIDSEIYYTNYSKDQERKKQRKLDWSEIQMIINEFILYNKMIKLFNINLNEKNQNAIPIEILNKCIEDLKKRNKKYQKIYDDAKYKMEEIIKKGKQDNL